MYTTAVQISKITLSNPVAGLEICVPKWVSVRKTRSSRPMRGNLANFKPSGEGVDLGAWDLETNKPALARTSHARDWEEYSIHTEVRWSVPYVPSYATTGGRRVW